jgi:hypothetical protein
VRHGGHIVAGHVHDEHATVAAVGAHDDGQACAVGRPRKPADHLAVRRPVDGDRLSLERRRDLDDGRVGSAPRNGVRDLAAPGGIGLQPVAGCLLGMADWPFRVGVPVRHHERGEPDGRGSEDQPDEPALEDGLEPLHWSETSDGAHQLGRYAPSR